jgi:hypothetical protein
VANYKIPPVPRAATLNVVVRILAENPQRFSDWPVI